MLRSRASILEAERTSFLNKRFHTVSPVWRKRAIRIIFMNTLCALRFLSFNLGARRLKVLLPAKTFWLERRGVCMPHVKMSLHSDRSKGSWPDAETEIRKKGNVKQDWAPKRSCCGPRFMQCTWTSIRKPTCTEHSCNLNSMRADENAKCGGWLERKWPKKK